MQIIKDLFFKNINYKQIILKNTFWIGFAEIFSRILKFLLIIYVIRILGVDEFGKFSFAFSIVTLFGFLYDFGLSLVITREFAKNVDLKNIFPALFSLKIVFGVITSAIIIILGFSIASDYGVIKMVVILTFYLFIAELCATFYAYFRAEQKMEYESWIKLLQSLLLIFVGFFFVFKTNSGIGLCFAYIISIMMPLLIVLYSFYHKKYQKTFVIDVQLWKKFIKMSWSLALIAGVSSICYYTDSVMLGNYGQIKETGIYNAMYKIIAMVIMPSSLIIQSYYPSLSSSIDKITELQSKFDSLLEIMMVLSIPILIGGMVVAPNLIIFLYGKEYVSGVICLRLLLLGSIFIYLYMAYNQILIVCNQEKKLFVVILIASVVNVLLNYFLIPKYSLNGASFATVISNIILFIGMLITTSKYTNIKIFDRKMLTTLLNSIISGFIMYMFIKYLKTNVLIVIIIAIFVYFISFFILKSMSKKHILTMN